MKYTIYTPTLKPGQKYIDFSPLWDSLGRESQPPLSGLSLASAGSMDISRAQGLWCREDFLNSRGFAGSQNSYCRQTHSQIVHPLGKTPLKGVEGDGFVSPAGGLPLTVTAADCMPVFLWDPLTGARGLCHSGWAGTGIALGAVKVMEELYGSRRENIQAILGPSIGVCCYQVNRERWEFFGRQWGTDAVSESAEERTLSLRGANRRLLEEAGIGGLVDVDCCTVCHKEAGSFRREGKDYTRMMAYMG